MITVNHRPSGFLRDRTSVFLSLSLSSSRRRNLSVSWHVSAFSLSSFSNPSSTPGWLNHDSLVPLPKQAMTTPCGTINANAIAAPSPSGMIFHGCRDFVPIDKRLVKSSCRGLKLPSRTTKKSSALSFRSPGRFLSSRVASASASASTAVTSNSTNRFEALEEGIEKVKRVDSKIADKSKSWVFVLGIWWVCS